MLIGLRVEQIVRDGYSQLNETRYIQTTTHTNTNGHASLLPRFSRLLRHSINKTEAIHDSHANRH